ncbi:MAG: nitroreductase family protein [Bacillota bacterium]
MDLMEVVRTRRSIRKYKPDAIPQDLLREILEAARLAPSGVNRQPWRFVLVADPQLKKLIKAASFNQRFVEEAPLLVVCCADLQAYKSENVRKRVTELIDIGALAKESINWYPQENDDEKTLLTKYGLGVTLNVAIAVEHLVLAAASFGLGTCWVQRMKPEEIRNILGLPDNMLVVALLPMGYPAEDPGPRPRLSLDEIIIDREGILYNDRSENHE